MSVEQSQNLSYLLHLWQVERNGEQVWWASLENPLTGERQAFADLAELFAFLDEKTIDLLQSTGEKALESSGETIIGLGSSVSNNRSRYLSYLLRLLSADREGNLAWRVSLQSPHATERLNFADLEALMSYLEEQLGQSKE
jgi:hypothetical protein